MSEITPFTIKISEDQITDLRNRINNTRWVEEECVNDWSQGIPLTYVREVADYWANQYDWRKSEKYLNTFDHYQTNINDLDIHFIHQKSPHQNAYPLVITHGWPGSIIEFHKVIQPLVNPTKHGGKAEDAFHVICPSLPGYGFLESLLFQVGEWKKLPRRGISLWSVSDMAIMEPKEAIGVLL